MLLSLFLLFSANVQASPELTAGEQNLKIQYQVHCKADDDSAFPGITGEVNFRSRTLRFHLFRYLQETEISLSANENLNVNELTFHFDENEGCTLDQFAPTLDAPDTTDFIKALAYQHSPVLVTRPDLVRRPDRDVPLGITYSVLTSPEGFSIRYTYFFSNETVHGPFDTTKAKSLGSWGRRSDIEWIYQVDFNSHGEVTRRIHQGGILLGIGHATKQFHGRFLKNSQHPILYNIAKHNVFGDHPLPGLRRPSRISYHLIPHDELKAPDAREIWLWNHAWTFDVTDRELRRDGWLSHPSEEYLYVRLQGSLLGHAIQLRAELDHETVWAGEGQAKIKDFDSDLWGIESYSAIHLPTLMSGLHGQIKTARSSSLTTLGAPRFYGLVKDEAMGFTVRELTPQFQCDTPYSCQF
jgi:hypothetical protein